jgi:hypothetical protein
MKKPATQAALRSAWEPHYTGIDTHEIELAGFSIYRQREHASRRINFLRLSNAWRYRRFVAPAFSLGLFLGRTNYGGHGRGFEAFAAFNGASAAAGFLTHESKWAVRWSGSRVEPFSSCILHAGRVFLAFGVPRFAQRALERRAMREAERFEAAYIASLSPEARAAMAAEEAHYANEEASQ